MSISANNIARFLPNNEYQAAVGANAPSASNPFVTGADLIGGGGIYSGSGTLPSTVVVSGNIGAYGIAFSQISEFFVTTQEAAGFTIRDTFAFDGTAQIVGLGLPGIGLLLEMNDGVSGGGIQQINLSGSQATGGIGMVVTDTADSTGLYYAGNYEANFVATSLVTKQYVDGAVAAANNLQVVMDNGSTWTGSINNAIINTEGYVSLRSEIVGLDSYAELLLTEGLFAQLSFTDIANTSTIELGTLANTITDGINLKGIQYAADYSSNFTARSLVDKAWVESQIAAISDNNGIFTGTNSGATIDSGFVVGLTDTIQWGLGSDNIRLDPSNNQIIFSNTGFGNITGTLIGYAGNTGNQTWTLPDNKSGIIALTSDIPAPDGNGIYDGNGTLPDAFTTSTIPINKGWILDGGVFYRNGQSNSSGVNTIFRSQDLSFNITIQDNGGLTQNNPNAGLLWGIDASRGLTNGGVIVAATGLSGVSWGTIQGKVGDTGINTNQTTYYLHSNTAREGIFDLYRQNVIAGRFKAAVGGVEFSEGDFTIKGANGTSDLFFADEDAETLSFDGVSYTFERNNSIVYFGSGGGRITVTSSGNMIISQANLFNCALQNTFNANTQQINNVKNLGLKTFQFGSGADGVLAWGVGTAPTTDNFNVVQSYTTDGTDLIFRNELGATVDIFSLGADGNGIYDGNGTIPSSTTATITDTLTFTGGDFVIKGSNGTSDLFFVDEDAGGVAINAANTFGYSLNVDTGSVLINDAAGVLRNDGGYNGTTAGVQNYFQGNLTVGFTSTSASFAVYGKGNDVVNFYTQSTAVRAFEIDSNGLVSISDSPGNITQANSGTTLYVGNATTKRAHLFMNPVAGTHASAITGANGMFTHVSSTDGVFTSVGNWVYENGAWGKLALTVNSGDLETTGNGNGIIVADATTGTRYRIYVDNGVLQTQLA